MRSFGRLSDQVVATVCTAIASSVLTFLALAFTGWIGSPSSWNWPLDIAVLLSIILIWGPAFALVPASIIGFTVERLLSRRLVVRSNGGFGAHLLIVTVASLCLWLLLRVATVLAGPQTEIVDPLSLAVFMIVGISSAICWWFLVILPGRRARAEGNAA